jgi:glutamate/tyrosine decarboxylase-like PLP-dependent enzyme
MGQRSSMVSDLTTEVSAGAGWPSSDAWAEALDEARHIAMGYLVTLPESPVSRHIAPTEMASRFDDPLPDTGCEPEEAVGEWLRRAAPGIVRSSGPRYFGFVTGGATPAALAGDWLASALDQNAGTWLMSPAAAQTELTVVRWLLDLFSLPASWSGALTTGATAANLCGLAAGRQWVSHRLGFDAARDGLGGKPPIPVISSQEIHQSALKALSILGLGRDALRVVPARAGVIDLDTFARTLGECEGPAIVVANAGEVNTGAFDPIRAMAERCAVHTPGVWLHVDAAFGLYAALSPRHADVLDGIALADSVASDAHKWLNVPYDCGIAFVRDRAPLRETFGGAAAYLNTNSNATAGAEEWNALEYVPEMSRRFRALAAWCSLRAMGRQGYEAIVARSVANAEMFAAWVATHPDLEQLAPAHLNIVCFRARDAARDDPANDALTNAVIEAIQRGGAAYVTGTRWDGRAAIRAAFDNWSTTADDVVALQQAVADATATCLAQL